MIHHRVTNTIGLTLALAATAAPVAFADPQPLTRAEAAIANHHGGALTKVGVCSEVCSAGGYGSVDQPAVSRTRSGAALPHDPRRRSVALGGADYGSMNVMSRSPGTTASCGDACSGGGYGQVTAPASVVRLIAPRGGFDWGDAGIGAGSALALTMIGVGGVLAATKRRGRQAPTGPRAGARI